MSTIVNDLVSHLQCGTSIAANDAVYIDSSDGKIYKFSATDDTQVFAGIAKEAGVLNDFIRVVQSGRVKGFTGLTPGQFVYASVTVPGSFQLVEPAASQKVILGIAKSTTELTINGGLGIKPGGDGSGGGLDAFYVEDMEGLADVADFASGNNASFLGGGTLQGTLALESVSPISGLKSLKYTQAAGSLNDYFASELIEIDPKQQNNTSGMTLYFTYDGNDNDMKFVVWDVTNSRELSNQVSFVKLASSATRYSLSFYVPASCTQIRWGAQVLVVNSGKVLVVDDVEMTTNPFHEGELLQTQSSFYGPGGTLSGSVVITGALAKSEGSGIYTYNSATGQYTFLKKANVVATMSNVYGTTAAYAIISVDGLQVAIDMSPSSAGFTANAAYSGTVEAGSVLTFSQGAGSGSNQNARTTVIATASTSHILTPSDTFSTDTAPLTYAGSSQYTLATLANAPIGTFITFTYAANTNTRTQTNAAPPTQTTASMNQNGIQIFTRAYTAASTAGNPAAIAIQIGKWLKGRSVNIYKSTGKTTGGNIGFVTQASSDFGLTYNSYDETTGILYLDAGGIVKLNTNTAAAFVFQDGTAATSGYLVINASKAQPLLAVPVPQVAYLKDVKPSGTAGGTFTSGAWQTRTLNTVEGGGSIVSLSANQVSIGPGRYEIEASAPAYIVGSHQLRFRNITSGTTSILGSVTPLIPSANWSAGIAVLRGTISLNQTSIFELQHRSTFTRATDGFGFAGSYGDGEVYSIIKISKVG